MQIKTERLHLKRLESSDTARVLEIMNQPSIYTIVSIVPRNHTERCAFAQNWVNRSIQSDGYHKAGWGIFLTSSGQLIGDIALHPTLEHHHGEVGYWLDEAFHQQGLMYEALKAVMHYAETHTGYTHLMAACALDNVASKHLLLKAGFQLLSESYNVPLAEGGIRRSCLLKATLHTTQKGTVD
jgi:ribosomal-protein-alanine N-acetyltransferase